MLVKNSASRATELFCHRAKSENILDMMYVSHDPRTHTHTLSPNFHAPSPTSEHEEFNSGLVKLRT